MVWARTRAMSAAKGTSWAKRFLIVAALMQLSVSMSIEDGDVSKQVGCEKEAKINGIGN